MHVAIQKRAHIFVSRRNFVLVQNADDNARIGHARDFDVVQIILNTEALFEGRFECLNARASGMDQRAVNVEKKETLLCLCHVEKNDEIRRTNDEGMAKVK